MKIGHGAGGWGLGFVSVFQEIEECKEDFGRILRPAQCG
jgi:hypothetical protein